MKITILDGLIWIIISNILKEITRVFLSIKGSSEIMPRRLKRENEIVLATETPQISIIPKKTEDIELEIKKDDLEPKNENQKLKKRGPRL